MPESIQSLSQREKYVPSKFTAFLWWLSTAEKELLKDCMVDRNRYAITGFTVLGTWAFATLAWSYFFYTVVSNVLAALLLGLFMGAIILGIDRALIKGINARNKQKFLPIIFRSFLALTIGTFMAQPALLYLFDKEIHVQISLDNEQKKRDKSKQQDSLFAANVSSINNAKDALQQQLNNKYAEVAAARQSFIAETDGTGGSKKIGLEKIAKAKQLQYEKLDTEYQQMVAEVQPQLQRLTSNLQAIEVSKQQEQKAFDALLNDGFLTRIEALQHLIKNNDAAAFRYYLLVAILVLIELMPVIAKSILPNGTYDEKVRLREVMEQTIAASNQQKELALKEQYNQQAFEQDTAFITAFFEEAKEERRKKMLTKFSKWRDDEVAFDSLWSQLRDEVLTKQEN